MLNKTDNHQNLFLHKLLTLLSRQRLLMKECNLKGFQNLYRDRINSLEVAEIRQEQLINQNKVGKGYLIDNRTEEIWDLEPSLTKPFFDSKTPKHETNKTS